MGHPQKRGGWCAHLKPEALREWYWCQVIQSGAFCEEFGSWLFGSGAALEGPARWLGMVIALLGAAVANPDATAHGVSTGWRRVQAGLARVLPCFRRPGVMHTASGNVSVTSNVSAMLARGIAPLVEGATVDEKVEQLDSRTRRLHEELGELQAQLKESDRELRSEIASAASELRQAIGQTRASVDTLDRETMHADASALPIIVVGVVLSGLSSDADSASMWFGLLVLVVVAVWSFRKSWRIFVDWRAGHDG